MPWMINTPDGRQYTCDVFDAPRGGTLHICSPDATRAATLGPTTGTSTPGVAPTEFTVESVEP
ncbi:hypothetical protein FEF26_15105 [Nesterenkonia salmonea]|uniref:Uncharacterized protein n=1 Tax=Nesterenkonia salmonea TaxID=1804987 RepID=A0A5R9B6R3_9MICC|nr:hypothetical protein [Nesterenkonia salmonea]TLP92115.1 hypothetical protein FEF26_15105 [Nesterenkonia salmonea]